MFGRHLSKLRSVQLVLQSGRDVKAFSNARATCIQSINRPRFENPRLLFLSSPRRPSAQDCPKQRLPSSSPSLLQMMSTNNGNGKAAFEVEATNLRPRWIPTVGYTVQNVLISIGVMIGACASLVLTCTVVFPLACIRAMFFSRSSLSLIPSRDSLRRGKVVLIVGASRGMGLEVLKQYCPEPETTIIAVSKNADVLRNAIIQMGDTPATLQMETLDLSGSTKSIADAVNKLDETYGPISHLYAIASISNHLNDNTPWNLDVTERMIKVNVSGTVALVMAMYERMKTRRYGKIVGSFCGPQRS
ncbi:hypothetical protein CC2G_012420 [Coprinopsis cinerea AmutBmut pab1-1]|nr:hypothetical protein CC2G_012420 [Coprinopsis cinerea AmutBmut pab1-1]